MSEVSSHAAEEQQHVTIEVLDISPHISFSDTMYNDLSCSLRSEQMSEQEQRADRNRIERAVLLEEELRLLRAISTTDTIIMAECPVIFLGGATEELLVSRIFSYLNSFELCKLAVCCKYFSRTTAAPKLWNQLLKIDFMLEEEPEEGGNMPTGRHQSARNYSSVRFSASSTSSNTIHASPKAYYIRKYRDLKNRIVGKQDEQALYENSIGNHKKLERLEWILDMAFVRILIPLPLLSIFCSLLMMGLYYDHVGVPMWVCAVPLLFLYAYFVVCVLALYVIFHGRYRNGSLLMGIWTRLNCPLKTIYQDVLQQSKKLVCFAIFGTVMGLLQVLLIAVKLSAHVTPLHIQRDLQWGIVFLPLWIMMAMFCISPVVGLVNDKTLFYGVLFVLWVPLCIIAVCLVVKLDGEDKHTSAGNMRLALIFMPLWFLEGFTLLGSSISMFLVWRRHRRYGLERESFDGHLGMFVFSWLMLSPYIIFQAMLSAIDDHGTNKSINYTKAIIPLLVLVGVASVVVIVYSGRYRYSFQDGQSNRIRSLMGAVDLFRV